MNISITENQKDYVKFIKSIRKKHRNFLFRVNTFE